MTQARRKQVCLHTTPYYHCIARCVRRAFLCGDDRYSGRNFDHRRQWIVDKLRELSAIFAVDIAAYAVMSNHYHAVLHVDSERAAGWSEAEVIARWRCLFTGPVLVQRHLAGALMTQAEREAVSAIVAQWRERLADVSWFMRCLNESIARRANVEDGCKGRFWEGRFKSQALLDERALLTCMAYVDLNPVRAGIAATPEDSDFTAIQERLFALAVSTQEATPSRLMPFRGNEHADGPQGIPFGLKDYATLVDWTGRAIRNDKKGHIPNHLPPVLERMGISPREWVQEVRFYGTRWARAAGAMGRLRDYAEHTGRRWVHGVRLPSLAREA